MKVVIANSIGIDKNGHYIIHSPSRWSEGVKEKSHWFAYYPWELAYLSSLLKRETNHEVKLIDGCLMKLNKKDYSALIKNLNPDILIIESATRMIDENLELALEIKKSCLSRVIFVGQHASAFPQQLIDQGVDNVCIGEYEFTVLELIQNSDQAQILGLYPNKRRDLLEINSLPWPEDDDVSRIDYACPGEPSSEFKEIQMYASRGCPGSCNFCVARHVYYNCSNWRKRNIDDIVKEIAYLKEKYPQMEGVFFDEEVHNGNREFILELSKGIIAAGLNNLHYEAMCDVRFLDEQVLRAMKNAGYYKIRIGIETASEKVMQAINKPMDLNHIQNILLTAKKICLTTYGTFTFGAFGSDYSEDIKTIRFMETLIKQDLLDGLQLSICTPQPGTPFYQTAKENNLLRAQSDFSDYDGGNFAMVSYPNYNHKQIENIKQQALLVRDHLYLMKKIREHNLLKWTLAILRRYGLWGFIRKAFRRFLLEIKFLNLK
ncbi:MAG: B12-binding domain-containing radical SAM protein [Candidatus Omnitrophica bacterium]|nr:B12-binding domain-containing radical SAM protein [Candidatus Omnitrophota bacterium]